MKKTLLKMLVMLLLIPVMVFVGCKNSKQLPKISTSKYFKNEIKISRNGFDETSTDSISLLTQRKAKDEFLSQYTKFELNAESVWIYKMYIESISFYVYCNESSEDQMIIDLKISDVATEDAIWESTEESVETETFSSQCTITPKARKAIKCNYEVNRTVVGATGSTLTIDILNSLELYSGDIETKSTFMWLIYGLEIHGESRTYSR